MRRRQGNIQAEIDFMAGVTHSYNPNDIDFWLNVPHEVGRGRQDALEETIRCAGNGESLDSGLRMSPQTMDIIETQLRAKAAAPHESAAAKPRRPAIRPKMM